MNDLQAASDEIEERTQGRVAFKIYGGGVMGDDQAVMRKIRARQLHGGIVQTGALDQIYPEIQMYNLPMAFRSFDEVQAVRTLFDQELEKGLQKEGFESLGIVGLGFAYAFSAKSVSSITDARKLKIWVQKGNRLALSTIKAFGLSAIPLSTIDVLSGMQSGLIDTITAPPVYILAAQWHTTVDYLLDLPFMYIYSVFVIEQKQFAKLSPEDQEIVRSVMGRTSRDAEAVNLADHDKATRALVNFGVQSITIPADQLRVWEIEAENERQKWVNYGILSSENFARMTSEISRIRGSESQ